MWPLGHLGVAYILLTLSARYTRESPPTRRTTVFLAFGSLLPDLIDKPLAWGFDLVPNGRSLAHSLLLLVPLCLLVGLLAHRYNRREYGVAVAIGALSHPFLDALPVLWNGEESATFLLWPVLSVQRYVGAPNLLELLRETAPTPYFQSEFVFFAIALVLWTRHRRHARYAGGPHSSREPDRDPQ
jgi:membrane-bound metal-dependent hydrolase YbcI (DUF457 family)